MCRAETVSGFQLLGYFSQDTPGRPSCQKWTQCIPNGDESNREQRKETVRTDLSESHQLLKLCAMPAHLQNPAEWGLSRLLLVQAGAVSLDVSVSVLGIPNHSFPAAVSWSLAALPSTWFHMRQRTDLQVHIA
jgi:hypothetical protein